jgi:hypothetical protein
VGEALGGVHGPRRSGKCLSGRRRFCLRPRAVVARGHGFSCGRQYRCCGPALEEPSAAACFRVVRPPPAGPGVWGLFFSFGAVRGVCFVPGRGRRLGSYSRDVGGLVDSRGVVVSRWVDVWCGVGGSALEGRGWGGQQFGREAERECPGSLEGAGGQRLRWEGLISSRLR